MIRKSILPLTICEFACETDLLQQVLHDVAALAWTRNDFNWRSAEILNTLPQFRRLHRWLDLCIEEARCELQLPFERLVITESWANKAERGQRHQAHRHPNSYMSGILYLTSAEDGQTQFFQPDQWLQFFLVSPGKHANQILSHTESPVAGKLLLFPSTLQHGVIPSMGNGPRLTVSFNVFPEGRIDYHPRGQLTFLHLKVIPYQEGVDPETNPIEQPDEAIA